MSEEERRRRISYREARSLRIKIQSVLLAVALIVMIVSAVLSVFLNNTYYVTYNERSSVDYGVHLKENDFYEEDFLGKDYAYIASLIDKMEASFAYHMVIDSSDEVDLDYTYRVDSVVEVKDKSSGKVLYSPVYSELEERGGSITGNSVSLKYTALVDYPYYNEVAERFIDMYKLDYAVSTLIVKMTVNVKSASEEFYENENNSSYVVSVSIPLASDTIDVKITSDVRGDDQKILSYTTEETSMTFKNIAKIAGAIALLLALFLIFYVYSSRNVDITYEIKVKRIFNSYRSFIQKILNEFDTSDRTVLKLSSFNEMLAIRDTIQSPILMYENTDRTCTKFTIPTLNHIVYLFEVKVDDYGELYRDDDPDPSDDEPIAPDPVIDPTPAIEAIPVIEVPTETVEQTVEEIVEEAIIEEPVVEEVIEEPVAEPAPVPHITIVVDNPVETILNHIVEIDNGEDDGTLAYVDDDGNIINITCSRSFTANLIQSNPQVKDYYNEIKNTILAHKGVKARTSWRCESYNRGRNQLFKLKIRGKTICLYCALDPESYDKAKYFHEKTDAKNFAAVPMMVRIKSDRGLKKAKELIADVMAKFEIPTNAKAAEADYVADYPYDTTKNLVERGLIKILIPGGSAAEPKPHHHVHNKTFEVEHEGQVDEVVIFEGDEVSEVDIEEMMEAPLPALEEIDFDDSTDPVSDFEETVEHPGVDVIGVVWPERPKRNKIYRYDPDGEQVNVGDVVVVPTRDASRGRDVIRRAAVAHSNHKIDPETLAFPLKKIVGVVHTKQAEDKKKK